MLGLLLLVEVAGPFGPHASLAGPSLVLPAGQAAIIQVLFRKPWPLGSTLPISPAPSDAMLVSNTLVSQSALLETIACCCYLHVELLVCMHDV